MASSEIDMSNDITVMEQKISELEVRCKQERKRLEQQKFILVPKDMLNASNKTSILKTGEPQIACQYCGSSDH